MPGWRVFLGLCVLASVLVHLLLWTVVEHLPPFKYAPRDLVEVKIVEKAKPKEPLSSRSYARKQIVRQALPPLDMLKPEPPVSPKYLSERDQNVKKEMQAKLPGLTQNRNFSVARNNRGQSSKKGGSSDSNSTEKGGTNNHSVDEGNERLRQLGQSLLNQMPSTSGEYLPDVKQGPITVLNSERFVYYSFFARIEERVRPIWERNVEDAQIRLPSSVQRQVLNHDWITNLEIILDLKGNYVGTKVHASCGIDDVDRAAILAFKEASFFPNPPKEMAENDGYIHLKYEFVVIGRAQAWARQGLPQ